MRVIDRYLQLAVNQKASDIHFSTGQPTRMRVHGDLAVVEESAFTHDALMEMLMELLTETEKQKLAENKNLDKSYNAGAVGNFRVNIFYTRNGVAAVLRTIPTRIPTMAELGLPDSLKALTDLPKGLILVTGPTGSGKSTTLAAMLNHINMNCPYHILTCEDPVEFVHNSNMCLVNQREIGTSCPTFADALRGALREDPDVILVGEMRDLETIALALTAAETGHLVFGTLHTRGAAASIDRIIDSFPGNQQAMIRTMLAESLAAVISQALLKKADGHGRVAAYEIMIVNHAISNLVREGKTFQIPSIIQTARKEGMILMDQHIKELYQKKIVSAEEASIYVEDGSIPHSSPSAAKGDSVPASKPASLKLNMQSASQGRPADAGEPAPPMRPTGAPAPAARPAAPRPAAPPADEELEIGGTLDLSGEEVTGAFDKAKAAFQQPPARPAPAVPLKPVARPGSPPPAGAARPPSPPGAPAAPKPGGAIPPPPVIGKKKAG